MIGSQVLQMTFALTLAALVFSKHVEVWHIFVLSFLTGTAQAWSPQKNVEIIVGSAPGGSNDKTARTVERMIVNHKLLDQSVTVVNKPGGGSSIAFTYVSQRAGDPLTFVATAMLLARRAPSASTSHTKSGSAAYPARRSRKGAK